MPRPLSEMPLVSGGARITGHATEFQNNRLALLRRIAEEGGEWRLLRMMGIPVVVAAGPGAVHELLVEKAKSFVKTVGIRMVLHPLAGEGLFTSSGELWRRQRKLMAPLFSPAFVEAYVPGMIDCIERWIDRRADGEVIDVSHEMTRITMNIVSRALFDADTDTDAKELGEAIDTVVDHLSKQPGSPSLLLKMQTSAVLEDLEGRLPPLLDRARKGLHGFLREPSPLPTAEARQYRDAIGTLNRLVDRMIDERRRAGLVKQDLLTRLLAARDEDDGSTMSDQQVRDEVLTLFFAGHETTAVALTWSLYALSQYPEVRRRAYDEVLAVPGGRLSAKDLPRFPTTMCCLKEALRLWPPAPMFDRVSTEDVQMGDYLIPRGTNFFVFPYAMHRRPDFWPDPERFDPDRFLPEAEKDRVRYTYVPFGAGPRVCIGMHFALLEGQLALASMLRRLTLTLEPGQNIVPSTTKVTLRPDDPLRMRVSLRRN